MSHKESDIYFLNSAWIIFNILKLVENDCDCTHPGVQHVFSVKDRLNGLCRTDVWQRGTFNLLSVSEATSYCRETKQTNKKRHFSGELASDTISLNKADTLESWKALEKWPSFQTLPLKVRLQKDVYVRSEAVTDGHGELLGVETIVFLNGQDQSLSNQVMPLISKTQIKNGIWDGKLWEAVVQDTFNMWGETF